MAIKSNQKIVSTDERKAFYAAEAAARPANAETNSEGVLAGAHDESAAATNGSGSVDVAGGPLNETELPAEPGDVEFAAANSAPMAVGTAVFDDPASMQVGAAANGHDPTSIFDDAATLRLGDTDADALSGTSEILAAVPVGKPSRHTFFRTHTEHFAQVMLFEDKDARETYFVAPCMHEMMQGEATIYKVFLVVTRQGQPILWPIRVDTDGRTNRWTETARIAVEIGKTRWTRIVPDMAIGHYRIHEAKGQNLAEPRWPKETMPELFKIAFRGRIIDSADHPVIRKLLGLV
jgi:hypothetical protein